MPDSVTEVTQTGLFGRIKNAIAGIFIGIILILVSFPVLWFNEANSAKSHAGLSELSEAAVSVSSDSVDASNEGKAVHLSGMATTDDILTDNRFKVSANAIKLISTVEMYQWEESESSTTEKKLGGGEETVTTYSYNKTWSERAIDSSRFKERSGHDNPPMPYESKTFVAKNVALGAFKLSDGLTRQVSGAESFSPSAEDRAKLPEKLSAQIKEDGPGYYIGENPSSPKVGDIRIRFEVVKPAVVSLIAKQKGGTFENYVAKNGKEFAPLRMGELSIENVIAAERSELKIITWIFRFVGWLVMFIGFAMLFKPLSVVADIVPFFGDIIETGTGIVAALIAAALSLTTIAIAWVAYRPLIGIPLLLGAIILIVLAFMKIGKAKKARLATA